MYVLSDFVCVSGNRASDGVTRKEVLSAQVTLGPLTGQPGGSRGEVWGVGAVRGIDRSV